ncbi:MAG: aminoacyl-tRNA hydrolase [Patescibacteria group bacterium]
MILIAGLGNPDKKYANTRHNVGFRAIDEFRGKNAFPGFKLNKKFIAEISESSFSGKKVILVKPQTFMNESGKAVRKSIENWKLEIGNLVVIHDDIDLPIGKIKIVKSRGSAGHKGVESIVRYLKNNDFVRIRIGIQPKTGKPKKPESFVLQKFSKDEEKILKEVFEKTSEAIGFLIKNGLNEAMNEFNK